MSAVRNIGRAAASGGLIIAACAACCAPLVAPWVVAVIAAGGAGMALAGQIGFAVLIAAAGGLYIWSRHRKQARKAPLPASSCDCGTEVGCSTPKTPSGSPSTNLRTS